MSADLSGPTIIDILETRDRYQLASKDGFQDKFYRIVPDDVDQIQNVVKNWIDGEDRVDWVITTGGTGFGVRDLTPEVGFQQSKLWDAIHRIGHKTFARSRSTRTRSSCTLIIASTHSTSCPLETDCRYQEEYTHNHAPW